MTKKERLAFKTALAEDPILQQQLMEVEQLFLDIETMGMVDQLENFQATLPQTGTHKKATNIIKLNHSQLAVAASIAILIVLGVWWFANSTPIHERIYGKYYRKPIGLPVVMGNNRDFEFMDAMVNYKTGEYDEAIRKWQILQRKNIENDTLNYFLGAAYLELGEPQKAISFLQKSADKDSSSFQGKAYLYLGFAYLKLNKLNEAESCFAKSETPLGNEIQARLKR